MSFTIKRFVLRTVPHRELTMKQLLLLSTLLLLIGCTELGEQDMHPSDWTETNSDNSHMAKIAVTGTSGCKDCHGGTEVNDYFGGTSGVSCYQCHAGGQSGHPAFNIWIGSSDNPNFHGNESSNRCKLCHGNDYRGGVSGVSCYTCHETI